MNEKGDRGRRVERGIKGNTESVLHTVAVSVNKAGQTRQFNPNSYQIKTGVCQTDFEPLKSP